MTKNTQKWQSVINSSVIHFSLLIAESAFDQNTGENRKTEGGGPAFTFRLPGEEIRSSALRQLRHWLWYIVFTYSKLSLLYCNKILAGGVA